MVRMNKVMLAGNLTRDPVVRKTPTGVACAEMGLAVNESYVGKDGKTQDSVCFVDLIVWDKQAETCGEYLAKGSGVMVEGKLQFDQWEDKDGQKRSRLRVKAERVQFIGRPAGKNGRGDGEGAGEARPQQQARRRQTEFA